MHLQVEFTLAMNLDQRHAVSIPEQYRQAFAASSSNRLDELQWSPEGHPQ
ncbi:MAG: hypothetical protein H0T45_19880 [Pyrinomonadaceae bacterium]|nr:hypothetical protein [Pyrinomonadaceae bacterium]